MVTDNRFQLDYAVHPGEYLEELLDACHMSQKELASRTDISTKHINLVISGKAGITARTAVALENALDRPARYWLDLQAGFDEFCERQERASDLEKHADWIQLFDYQALVRKGLVPQAKDRIQKGLNLLAFFQVSSVAAWYGTWKTNPEGIFCRSAARTGTDVSDRTVARLSQWIRIGQLTAQITAEDYPPFNPDILEQHLQEIRGLSVIAEFQAFIAELTGLLREAGVLLQFVKEIGGMRTFGTSFMVRNNEVACIQLCLRGRTNDQLWFSLLHEINHLLNRGNSKGFLIGHSKDPEEEKAADDFAQELLIPPAKYQAFLVRNDFSARAVTDFSQEIGVHAGIVIGRLQHERRIGFNSLNHLKARCEWTE